MSAHIFAYGSLAADLSGRRATLRGFHRVWGVAMDNRRTIPGYKVYRLPDGSRPDVCVAFLDLEAAPDEVVDGVLIPVDAVALGVLDRRERNYERVDVTAAVDMQDAADAAFGHPIGRVWTYLGRADSRERLRRARADGRAVVGAAYIRSVARFAATTVASGLPQLELRREDVPAGPAASGA